MIAKKGVLWTIGVGGVILLASLLDSEPDTQISPFPYPNPESYKSFSIPQASENLKEVESDCHPSYLGACLKPDVSDYDCAGGSGNGPYYTGTVQVVGYDEFGLDRDGDGWGCE